MFMFGLAEKLGMPVGQMMKQMTDYEYLGWKYYVHEVNQREEEKMKKIKSKR